jgi:hypothetical protein
MGKYSMCGSKQKFHMNMGPILNGYDRLKLGIEGDDY